MKSLSIWLAGLLVLIALTGMARADFFTLYADAETVLRLPLQAVVADVEGLGTKSILVTTKEKQGGLVTRHGVYEYSPEGALLREYRVPVQFDEEWSAYTSPSVGDVTGDGQSEVVFCIKKIVDPYTQTRILIYSNTGTLLYDSPLEERIQPSMASLADADGDGILDIFVQNSVFPFHSTVGRWVVYRYTGLTFERIAEGEIFGSLLVGGARPNWDAPIVCDMDLDGNLDMLVRTNILLERWEWEPSLSTFELRWQINVFNLLYYKAEVREFIAAPVAFDGEPDGIIEIGVQIDVQDSITLQWHSHCLCFNSLDGAIKSGWENINHYRFNLQYPSKSGDESIYCNIVYPFAADFEQSGEPYVGFTAQAISAGLYTGAGSVYPIPAQGWPHIEYDAAHKENAHAALAGKWGPVGQPVFLQVFSNTVQFWDPNVSDHVMSVEEPLFDSEYGLKSGSTAAVDLTGDGYLDVVANGVVEYSEFHKEYGLRLWSFDGVSQDMVEYDPEDAEWTQIMNGPKHRGYHAQPVSGIQPHLNVTWSGRIVVHNSYQVPQGYTLVIEPGTIVEFRPGAWLYVEGTLIADGIATDRIHFKADGIESWDGIYVRAAAQTIFRNCDIHGGDYGLDIALCELPQTVEYCHIYDMNECGISAYRVLPGNLMVKGCSIENCKYGIKGSYSAGFFDRNSIANCQRAGIFWTGDHPNDPAQPFFFGNSICDCGTNSPIAGGYFVNTGSKLICNSFVNNHGNQLLCESSANLILNGTYTLGEFRYKGSNTFQGDEIAVTCYGDWVHCISLVPPLEWKPLLTISFSQPSLADGNNNFAWNVDGTYIETKLRTNCRTQPVHEIGQNFFSPSSELPGPGNDHFCPYQLFSARHGFRTSPSMCAFPIEDGGFVLEGAEEAYFYAVEAEEEGNPAVAETAYLSAIETYPTTIYALWSTAGYLRTIKQQGKDPLEAYQVLSTIASDIDYSVYLQKVATMDAIRSLLTAQQYDSAEQDLGDFLSSAVSFEDSAWAILMLEAIPLLESAGGGGGPSIQSVRSPQSLRATIEAYDDRVLELLGHKQTPTSQEEAGDFAPANRVITSNFPNPFNPVTEIQLILPSSGKTRVDVYNLLGQHIATLVNKELDAGEHRVQWDASNTPSGIYFYKISFGSMEVTRKMILIR